MYIERLEIEEFGKLVARDITLGRGMNLIEGENEAGKSTLLAFIRFQLYGFPRRAATPEGGERDRRLSWAGRRAAGSLSIVGERGKFLIKRSAVLHGSTGRETLSEQLRVVNLDTGEQLKLKETPGEYFLGLPAELFDSSLCVRQSDIKRISAPGVGEAVGSLLFAGEAGVNGANARAILDEERRRLQHLRGRGGKVSELEDALFDLRERLTRARADTERLSELRESAERQRALIAERRAQLTAATAALDRASLLKNVSLFDAWHAAVRESEAAKTAVEAVRAQYKDVLPLLEGDTLPFLQQRLEELAVAEATLTAIEREREACGHQEFNEEKLATAAKVAEMGGRTAVMTGLAAKERAARKYAVTGCILALLSVGAAVAAVPLIPLRVGLFAVAYVGVLGSCAAAFLARRHRRAVRNTCAALSITDAGVALTYLFECDNEADRKRAHLAAAASLEARHLEASAMVYGTLDSMNEELAGFGLFGTDDEPTTPSYVQSLLQEAREAERALHAVLTDQARADATAAALAAGLPTEDEARLRARAAALSEVGDVTESSERLQEKKRFLEEAIAGLESKRAETEREEIALAATVTPLSALWGEEAATAAALAEAQRELSAVTMAMTALDEAEQVLRRGVTPKLCEDASTLFVALTGGAYERLLVAPDFSLSLPSSGGVLPVSQFSAGCRDAAYLSLRLALLRTLSTERLPLLLDEAFSRLDDTRARALFDILQRYAGEGGQCLLLTCHTREAAWLSDGDVRITL